MLKYCKYIKHFGFFLEVIHSNTGNSYYVGSQRLISIAVTKDEVYWTERNVDELFWTWKSNIITSSHSARNVALSEFDIDNNRENHMCRRELYTENKKTTQQKKFFPELPVKRLVPLVTVQCQIQDISKVGCRDNNGNCSHVCLPTSFSTYVSIQTMTR